MNKTLIEELIYFLVSKFPQKAMTRNDVQDKYGEDICMCCPWTLGEVNKPRIGMCDGAYCQTALDRFMDENNIKEKL